jgi:hypothetical protein
MPTGALTLVEATKAGSDQVKMGVVETIIQENPMLEVLPWMPFEGTALRHFEEGTLPNVQFRNVNEGYTPSWGSDNDHYWGVAILGGEVKVDKFLENVTASRERLMAKQFGKLAKANSLRFSWEAFDGTGAASTKGFKGINALIDEGFGQKNLQASGGGALSLAKLDESIDLFINQGQPDVMWANRYHRRKITQLARETYSGVSLIDIGTDTFGRKVTTYDGIPIRIIGNGMDSSGNVNAILGFDEDPGDGTSDCSSIYFAKLGEDDVTGLLGKGGTFEAYTVGGGELESGPQYLGRMEWYPGIAIFNQYSIVRHYGVTQA